VPEGLRLCHGDIQPNGNTAMTYNYREDGEFGEGANMASTIKEHLIAAAEATWRVREVRKFHADDEHTTLEALEIWSEDDLICEDVDNEANARLIAAAPEMLGALRSIPDRADQVNAEAFSEAMDDWWKETALPALAKAEGRQP